MRSPTPPLATTILTLPNLSNHSLLWRGPLLTAIAWLALSAETHAVTPAPDGGYPGANTAEGDGALSSLTTGSGNTAIGSGALQLNTTGNVNTATGDNAMEFNTTGSFNTAAGFQALSGNTAGSYNTANGYQALFLNNTGLYNTASGSQALLNNKGNYNTASGNEALFRNTTGNYNAATGSFTLHENKGGYGDTANGFSALYSNTSGYYNTADGYQSLFNNTTGVQNTANGLAALYNNTAGGNNTAQGYQALYTNTTGSNNIAVGNSAGVNLTIGSNNIDIGAPGAAGESKKIRIGKQGTQNGTFIAGISAVAVTGTQVVVNSSGKLGVAASSARFKEAIKPMENASEAILALKPVTFRYKQDLDPDGVPQFGLVAEQVEKVNPDLVARDAEGKVNTVRYEAVNAMLLNEFLKEHRKVEEQGATITQLKEQIQILTATVQKVSDQVRLATLELVGNEQ